MQISSRYGVSYPDPVRDDRPDVPLHLKNLVDGLERSAMYGQGTFALRPVSSAGSPGIQGRFYMATDLAPHVLYYDYGTGWDTVGNVAAGSVGTAQLADDSITGGALGAGVKVKQGTITHDNLVAGTIRGGGHEIAAGTIAAADLLAGVVAGPGFGTAFPTVGLFNGYMFILFVTDASGSVPQMFMYRADLDATYPWHYVGGGVQTMSSDGTVSTASSTYIARGTTITCPRAGTYMLRYGALVSGAAQPADRAGWVSPKSTSSIIVSDSFAAIGGQGGSSDNGSVSVAIATQVSAHYERVFTLSAAAEVVQLFSRANGTNSASFSRFNLTIIPKKCA